MVSPAQPSLHVIPLYHTLPGWLNWHPGGAAVCVSGVRPLANTNVQRSCLRLRLRMMQFPLNKCQAPMALQAVRTVTPHHAAMLMKLCLIAKRVF